MCGVAVKSDMTLHHSNVYLDTKSCVFAAINMCPYNICMLHCLGLYPADPANIY